MLEKLKKLQQEAKERIKLIKEVHDLNQVKAEYLGKKGVMADMMKLMKDLTPEERPKFGQITNEAKQTIQSYIDVQKTVIEDLKIQKALDEETVDVTLPGREFKVGTAHPLSQVVEEIEDLFIGMGYGIEEGPEVESDHYNFELLNLPKGHPARDMQDSFYITDETLLRTHTSPVQARTMLAAKGKPVKIICPGKVYRRDDDDATHSHQFMQIEGLVIDKDITMADLKGTLLTVAKQLFGNKTKIRLRPSYFPFTEPSVEVDVTCFKCQGGGCNICKGTGWLEILGAGMVNKNVLEMCGYDSNIYQGFAFGMGAERIAMLKYGIDDIRNFYTNDIRFINQFKGGKF